MATGLVKRWGVISQQRSAIAEIASRKCAYQYAVSTRDISALVVAVLSVSLQMARWVLAMPVDIVDRGAPGSFHHQPRYKRI
jgi:hypothetical protein